MYVTGFFLVLKIVTDLDVIFQKTMFVVLPHPLFFCTCFCLVLLSHASALAWVSHFFHVFHPLPVFVA